MLRKYCAPQVNSVDLGVGRINIPFPLGTLDRIKLNHFIMQMKLNKYAEHDHARCVKSEIWIGCYSKEDDQKILFQMSLLCTSIIC